MGWRATHHSILYKNRLNVQLKKRNAYENYKNQIVRPRPHTCGGRFRISETRCGRNRETAIGWQQARTRRGIDALRDEAWRAMRKYVKASTSYPVAEVAQTATEVYELFKKYGDLATLPQTEETGRLHNLLQDLNAMDDALSPRFLYPY
ncbi:MAG: DUF6261 family protein [Phocaeicola sp.]|uniref:DUF6261 family protein n=1 Tax=Phocaeicola sp. TaxID=2773926 RepID=UPI003FA1007E